MKKKKGLLAESINRRSIVPVSNVIEIKETTDEAMGTTDVKSQSEPSDIEEESGVEVAKTTPLTKKRSVAHLKSLQNKYI